MDWQLRPEPSPEERAALAVALERLDEDAALPAPYRSRWRDAGIRESVSPREPPAQYPRPRVGR